MVVASDRSDLEKEVNYSVFNPIFTRLPGDTNQYKVEMQEVRQLKAQTIPAAFEEARKQGFKVSVIGPSEQLPF